MATQSTPSDVASNDPVRAPNIVVIIADDLGYGDVSTYLPGRIATPNIDRIGREGAVFTQGYVTAPICSPSRAGLMTGRYQHRYGFEYNNGPANRDVSDNLGLDPGEITLGQFLQRAGYRTAAIGKWHLGSNDEYHPTNRGFDEYWGFLTGQTNYIRPDAPDAVNFEPPPKEPGAGIIHQPVAVVNELNAVTTGSQRKRVDLGDGFLTEQTTAQALDFIEKNKAKPFFLYIAHHAPHTPLQVSKKYYDRFPNIADRGQRIYAGMVSALDEGVGAVLDKLDQAGLGRDTLVVFLSDNGCAAYLPGLCSAEALSGGKLTYLEGGIRVPYLVRWPRRISAGTIHGAPVSSLDIFPTVAAAVGAPLPADRAYDGIDLITQLQAKPVSRDPLFWRTRPMQAVREGDWKFYKDLDGVEFLYNVERDPLERDNLAAAEPARVASMKALLERWQGDKIDPKWPGRSTEFEFGGRKFKFKP